MGLCGKNKAKAPSKRSKTVGIEAQAPLPVTADVLKEEPPVITPEAEVDEEVVVTPRSEDSKNAQKDEAQGTDESSSGRPSRGIGPTGVHGNPPPTRHDSSATSCAGMTDADPLSRPGTMQPEKQPTAEPACAPVVDKESVGQSEAPKSEKQENQDHPSSGEEKRHVSAVADEDAHDVQDSPKQESEGNQDEAESKDKEDVPPPEDFISRVHETFTNVKKSLSRGYESLRSGHVSDGLRRASTGDYTEMHPTEQCLYGVLNDITEFGERALPCMLGENSDENTETSEPPMPQIVMIVNTPGGPYLRRIPDELVADAVDMGFITEEEVQRQRDEWERNCGRIPVEYKPAISLAEQASA